MTVAELIEHLRQQDQGADVGYCTDAYSFVTITEVFSDVPGVVEVR